MRKDPIAFFFFSISCREIESKDQTDRNKTRPNNRAPLNVGVSYP